MLVTACAWRRCRRGNNHARRRGIHRRSDPSNVRSYATFSSPLLPRHGLSRTTTKTKSRPSYNHGLFPCSRTKKRRPRMTFSTWKKFFYAIRKPRENNRGPREESEENGKNPGLYCSFDLDNTIRRRRSRCDHRHLRPYSASHHREISNDSSPPLSRRE